MKKTIIITVVVASCLGLLITYALAQKLGSPSSTDADTSSVTAKPDAPEKKEPDKTATPDNTAGAESKDSETKDSESKDAEKAKAQPESEEPAKPKEPEGVSVSFKDMKIDKICEFLSENLKKPVIPSESLKDKKLTIVSKEKMPVEQALYLVRQALLAQGIMVEQQADLIYVRPVSEIMQSALVRLGPAESATTIDDPLQFVTKEFLVKHYEVSKMVEVIKPMLPEFAHIIADPDSRKLAVTDTVANILRIEQVVASVDVPLAEQTVTEILKLEHADAAEITSIVRWLIAGRMGIPVKDITTASGSPPGRSSRGGPPSRPSGSGGGTGVTTIESSQTPVMLVPNITRNWIIVVAPAEIMAEIKIWVKQLDKPREVEKDYELYDVKYADVEDIAQQINQTFQNMPSVELRENTHAVPFGRSKKLIVFGSKRGRELAKELLEKIDLEDAEKRTRKTFALEHADAEEMAERIESLFSEMEVSYRSTWGTSYRRSSDAAKVSVVTDVRRNSITVITDPDTMKEVEALVLEEDTPIDPGDVGPKIYELKYADPVEVKDLLSEMFSGQEGGGGNSFWDAYFGRNRREVKPVGRLLGQFMFQVLPSSNKLVVQTKSVANFEVIDKLIAELDQPQRAGLPLLIELKFANAEDLCEQLNAMLAEPGTIAKIRRAERGLSDYHSQAASASSSGSSSSNSSATNQRSDPEMIEFWWQPWRRPEGSIPTSNLVGKIRLVPVYRRNAVMVLAPSGFVEPIQELILEMDQPGRQVVIQARIGEIQHNNQTTLGLRFASDPSILSPADTAVAGRAGIDFGNLVFNGTTTISAGADVTVLINLLIQKFGMKILLEPSLTTSDNEAAEYFDGQDVSVATEVRDSSEGTSTVTGFTYEQVGTRLRIRPHITKEGSVDLLVNLEISRIVPGTAAQGGNPTFDRREVTTHVIVSNGQTIMLSGIIRQDKFLDLRKFPLLGDLPFVGGLFRSIDEGVYNRELVVFITPRVMTSHEEVDAEMIKPLGTLHRIEQSFDEDRPGDDGVEP